MFLLTLTVNMLQIHSGIEALSERHVYKLKKEGGGGCWSLHQNINILEQTVSCITEEEEGRIVCTDTPNKSTLQITILGRNIVITDN